MIDKILNVIAFLVIVFLMSIVSEDHFRLSQVRQQLMDHGTPIEMDKR
jgi:hypothetical protein